MAQPSEFRPYLQTQLTAEEQLRKVLADTAKAIEARIKTLGSGRSGQIRAAQLRTILAAVRRAQRLAWRGPILDTIIKQVEAAEKAGEDAVEALTRAAYAALPDDVAQALVDGLRASAESGLKSDRARKRRELSRMVYRQEAFQSDKLERIIRQGIISQLSAKELAATAKAYVDPATKGGASYAAMRLARTEINNAFHERQLEGAKRPGVKAVVWNLSGSHKVPDKCNVYAAHGGNGQWAPDKVPDKPHPQCFCYLTYVTTPPDEFRSKLEAGDFDDEIARRTRENMARLGQKVGDVEPPKATRKSKLVKGKDQTEWAADMMRDGNAKNGMTVQSPFSDPRDTILKTIGERQGYDALPSIESLDDEIERGGIELWRGVVPHKGNNSLPGATAEDIIDNFRSGKYEPGTGIYGNGYYFSVAKRVGEYFAAPDKKTKGGKSFRAVLRKDAKVIEWKELKALKRAWGERIEGNVVEFSELVANNFVTPPDKYPLAMIDNLMDDGRFAALIGYDAIRVIGQQDGAPYVKGEPSAKHQDTGKRFSAHDQYVILNRSAVIMEAE